MDLNKTAHGSVLSESSLLVYRLSENRCTRRHQDTFLAVSDNVEKKDGTINIIKNAMHLNLFYICPCV